MIKTELIEKLVKEVRDRLPEYKESLERRQEFEDFLIALGNKFKTDKVEEICKLYPGVIVGQSDINFTYTYSSDTSAVMNIIKYCCPSGEKSDLGPFNYLGSDFRTYYTFNLKSYNFPKFLYGLRDFNEDSEKAKYVAKYTKELEKGKEIFLKMISARKELDIKLNALVQTLSRPYMTLGVLKKYYPELYKLK